MNIYRYFFPKKEFKEINLFNYLSKRIMDTEIRCKDFTDNVIRENYKMKKIIIRYGLIDELNKIEYENEDY